MELNVSNITDLHIYTIEGFIAYGDRLHINSIIDIIINGVATFVVWNYSTKAMKTYKYYILLTIFCTFLMDFHVTFIYGPFLMLPSTIICGAGIFSRNMNSFWGSIFQFVSSKQLLKIAANKLERPKKS